MIVYSEHIERPSRPVVEMELMGISRYPTVTHGLDLMELPVALLLHASNLDTMQRCGIYGVYGVYAIR